jgi:hypothetical protein
MEIIIKEIYQTLTISTDKKLVNNNYITPKIYSDFNIFTNESIIKKTLKKK